MKKSRALSTALAVLWIGLGGFAARAIAQPTEAPAIPVRPVDTPTADPLPEVSVILSPREVRVGELVLAVLTVEQDARLGEPRFPNWQQHWGDAEIREIGKVTGVDLPGHAMRGRALYSQELELTAFRPGIVELPPQTVTLLGDEPVELRTQAATFEVVSVLPAGGDEEIEAKPPAPPRPLPLGNRFWWAAGLLSLLIAALLGVLFRRHRADAIFAGEVLDPWAALEAALARLAAAADAETAFTGLSLELRRYLGRTLAFPAAESTTTELRRRLIRSGLPQSICGDVVRLLVEADTVKFARKDPAPGRVQACLDQARVAAAEVRRFLAPTDLQGSNEEEAA